MRVEHEYTRGGAWAYLAALDVHRAKLFGRCEPTTGIDPFHRLMAQVMAHARMWAGNVQPGTDQAPPLPAKAAFLAQLATPGEFTLLLCDGQDHQGQPLRSTLTVAVKPTAVG